MSNCEKFHQDMRDTLSNKLFVLAKDDSLWNNYDEPKLYESNGKSSSIHLLNKLSKFFRDEIMTHSKSHNFRQSLHEYSKQMVKPVTGNDNTEERLKKYGGSIALHTFSCVHGVDVWVLQPTNKKKFYKWQLISSDENRFFDENINYEHYVTLLYQPHENAVNNHYDVVISDNSAIPPSPNNIYCDGEVQAITPNNEEIVLH